MSNYELEYYHSIAMVALKWAAFVFILAVTYKVAVA